MGVSGCGKTTTGQALSDALGWPFFDGDDFHPEENVAKMAEGRPLTDEDRWPWLDRLAEEMRGIHARGDNAVFACSALKDSYRRRLFVAGDVRVVHLKGDAELIGSRLAQRAHRYMPASLLGSQFATLEEPAEGLVIDVRDSVATQVERIRDGLAIAAQGQA